LCVAIEEAAAAVSISVPTLGFAFCSIRLIDHVGFKTKGGVDRDMGHI
jgi:hypothetical protein